MPPSSVSKPKGGGTQQTLFGFFGKAAASTNATSSTRPAAPTSQGVKDGSHSASPTNLSSNDSLTPPPTVRKPSNTSNQHRSSYPSSSSSPTDTRANSKPMNSSLNATTRRPTSELTPPSSSPPIAMEEDDDEDRVSSLPRRRAAVKRNIQYIESDDEEIGRNDSDDDGDRFSPERISRKKATKKSKYTVSDDDDDDDDDDEFDDFIVPDDEMLGVLEKAEANRPKAKKAAATVTVTKPSVPAKHWSSSARSLPNNSGPSKMTAVSKKATNEELPYDFLLNPHDENGNPPNHPDFDPRTLFIPESTLRKLTPFEKQYWEIKKKHNDTVLFFQKGKFFELYEDDAIIAHREFGLKLTDRVKMKMAGVPESSYTMFANKFLGLGYKIGRVDQTETAVGKDMRKSAATAPKSRGGSSSVAASDDSGSKIVRRDLKSIMTAGTIVDADCLPDEMSSYCISIKEVIEDDAISGHTASGITGGDDEESMQARITFGVCILDAGVAQFHLHHFIDDVTRTKFETLLRSLRVKEVLYEKGHLSKRTLRIIRNIVDPACNITMLKSGVEFLDKESTLRKLNLVLNKDLADYDPNDLDAVESVDVALLPPAIAQSLDKVEAMSALGAMLNYLTQLHLDRDICASRKFDIFDHLSKNNCMILDAQSLTHLNVLLNEQGDMQGTLLQLVNRAITPFGKRLMKVWLLSPLARLDAIRDRQDAVEEFLRDSTLPDTFETFARSLPDIERIMPRIYAGNCKAKDFASVLRALSRLDKHVNEWKELAGQYNSTVVGQLLEAIPSVSTEAKRIQNKYEDESFEPKRGNDKVYDAADDNIDLVEKNLLNELAKAAQKVKLPKDKVKFKDIGTNEIYQIEVPIKTSVPVDWALISQTQSVKRYYSPEIRILVKQLKEARETRVAALKAFQSTLNLEFQQYGDVFLQAIKGLAELDCLVSLAKASRAMNEPTCRPDFVDTETAIIDFTELRHPCLANASTTDFIANDIRLGGESEEDPTVTILTGGNMAGKSTTARTTATGVILAQLGCRVPAMAARLSPIDRIATRMGANDQIFRNNSTFMVEMLEASRILKDGSPRSLVIMDELGRGTSTFDGQAIAYSVLHYLIGQSRCLCFFLTHYTQLAFDFEAHLGVRNKHMQVLVDNENKEVVFTYKLINGIAESSYGTEVAALAGIPSEICARAHSISKSFLESTREMEAQRKHNVQSKLETATVSDFVYLLRAGLQEKADNEEALSDKTIAFMRKQMQHLFSDMDAKSPVESSTYITSEDKSEPRVYSRRPKRPREESKQETGPSTTFSEAIEMEKKKNSLKRGNVREEQMVLDLGQKIQITCKDCGMSYDRSELQDCATHEKHHNRVRKGLEWTGKQLLRQSRLLCETKLSKKGTQQDDKEQQVTLLAYDWNSNLDSTTLMALQQVQEVMDEALGATPISPLLYKDMQFILAVSNGRVIGSLLVGPTPIGKARRVESNPDETINDALVVPKEDYIPAEKTPPLGIYRIHVLKIARRFGLASAMLDAALSNCVYGMSAEALVKYHKGKSNTTAFSQPTQAGRYLAEAWIHSSPNKKDFPNHQQLLVFDEGV